jgi:ribonuclease R
MDAVITSVEPFGIFAQGIEVPAEGLVPISVLPADSYHFDRTSKTLSGFQTSNQFRLGDRIHVRVSRVDTDRREMEYELVSSHLTSRPQRKTQKSTGPRSPRSSRSSRQPRKGRKKR